MSADNSGVAQELGFVDHATSGSGAWGDHQSQQAYDTAVADHQGGTNSQSWLFFDPMFGASPSQGPPQAGYGDDGGKLPFNLGGPETGDGFRRAVDVKSDPTLDSIFTPYERRVENPSRPAPSRKCERRRPRRTASASNSSTRSFSPSWSTRRAVGNKSFSNSLNRFTHPDENGKRKIRNEIMSIAESLPALPGLYFDKKQKGFRVRYQNVYVGWVALSRYPSIEEAYISAREIWESAKCHAEKYQTPHAAVMASYPLQKEAQASGKNRGGRPRTVTQLPPDPTNWLNSAFMAHQTSASVPLTSPYGDGSRDVPPLGFQPPPPEPHNKRRCSSPPQQSYWPWLGDNFVLSTESHEHPPQQPKGNFWGPQPVFVLPSSLEAASGASVGGDPAGSFTGFSQGPPGYLSDCLLDQSHRPLCHPPAEGEPFDDPHLAPFPGATELPGAISFSQPVPDFDEPKPPTEYDPPPSAEPLYDHHLSLDLQPQPPTSSAPPPLPLMSESGLAAVDLQHLYVLSAEAAPPGSTPPLYPHAPPTPEEQNVRVNVNRNPQHHSDSSCELQGTPECLKREEDTLSPAAATTAAPPGNRKKRRREEDSSVSGEEESSMPPTKRRWPLLRSDPMSSPVPPLPPVN